MKGELIVNNVRLELGHVMVNELAYMVEDVPGVRDICHELAKSPCCETRSHIASRKCLHSETVAILLPDPQIEVMRAMIDNDNFISRMKKADVERFIDTNDPEILAGIVNAMADLTDTYEVCERDWLCEKLFQNPDPAVRFDLANTEETPEFFLNKLTRDPDLKVSRTAKDTLEDIDGFEFEDDEIPM